MIRNLLRRTFLCGGLLLSSLGVARAEEPFDEFLSGLHERQHGELAVHYLKLIKDRPDLPEDLKTTWDLEMARSLRIAAEETPNTDLKQKYVVEAQAFLDKFLKEHAEHEEAAAAQLTSGDISLFRAQNLLRVALKDKNKRDTLPEARTLLAEARTKYEKAAAMYKTRVDEQQAGTSKKKSTSARAKRQAAELVNTWYGARFKVATTDYNLGLSYPEPKDPKRKEVLTKAAKGFDGIFQENRGGRMGVLAHMWEGKCREEMEDYLTALDIYDEVMAATPDKDDKREAQWAAMFNEVNRYRLMLLGRTKNYEKLINEATFWLGQNEFQKRSTGYQGIALELAKAHLERAKTLKGAEATQANKAAKDLLSKIISSGVPGEFQKEAILLSRTSGGQGEAAPINSFDEAIAIGDAASKAAGEASVPADIKANWQEAEKAYQRALELSADVKDKNRVLGAQFALAWAQYLVGKPPEAYATAMKLAKENPQYAKSPASAALAVNAALYLYGQARDQAAMDRINEATDFLLKTWPQHSEADDARIARGKLKIFQNDLAGAVEIFKNVNPASDRYPSGLYLAGQVHWMLFNNEKRKGEGAKAAELTAQRTKTVEFLQQCITSAGKQTSGASQAQTLADAQLLLAEVKLDENKFEEALPLLQPLVESLKSNPPASFDKTTLRILISAMRVYSAMKDTAKSLEIGQLLLNGGDDIPPVNAVLIEYTKIIQADWKRTAADLIVAKQSNEEGLLNNATMAETTSREELTKLLTKLSERKAYDLAGLVFLAEAGKEIGLTEKAREQFQAILERAGSDPAFARQAARAMTRVRAQLIGLLREEGKFDDALKQVDALLKEQPNALEPLMEKGNILQTLAEKDPKKYDEAVRHWTSIRVKLQNLPKKPKEYYDVIYNCAFCLVAQKQPDKYEAAAKLLSGTLALSPDLDGPDRVEKFKALQKQIPASATKSTSTKTKTAKKTK